MLTKSEFDDVLEILKIVILSSPTYKKLYQHIRSIKLAKGSCYGHISEDGLSKLSLVHNENYLETADRVTIYTHLNRMAQDFSVLSAMSISDWEHLADLLTLTHGRVTEPYIFMDNKRTTSFSASNNYKAIKPIASLMISNPWVMLILLMEICYINV